MAAESLQRGPGVDLAFDELNVDRKKRHEPEQCNTPNISSNDLQVAGLRVVFIFFFVGICISDFSFTEHILVCVQ